MLRGAEAVLKKTKKGFEKARIPKGYRHPKLDEQLRTSRTKQEYRLLEKAVATVPKAEMLDETTLLIEEIPGKLVKELLDERPELAKEIGENLAKLHDQNVIHGDVTTSNMIFNKKVYFIDFGLGYVSRRVEDKAVDIHLFRQALESRHHIVKERAYKHFLQGYKPKERKEILERLKKVEVRGKNKCGS